MSNQAVVGLKSPKAVQEVDQKIMEHLLNAARRFTSLHVTKIEMRQVHVDRTTIGPKATVGVTSNFITDAKLFCKQVGGIPLRVQEVAKRLGAGYLNEVIDQAQRTVTHDNNLPPLETQPDFQISLGIYGLHSVTWVKNGLPVAEFKIEVPCGNPNQPFQHGAVYSFRMLDPQADYRVIVLAFVAFLHQVIEVKC